MHTHPLSHQINYLVQNQSGIVVVVAVGLLKWNGIDRTMRCNTMQPVMTNRLLDHRQYKIECRAYHIDIDKNKRRRKEKGKKYDKNRKINFENRE